MILELYDKEHTNKYPLTNLKDMCIKHTLRYGDKELSFSIPLIQKYADIIEEEMYIRDKITEYVIKEVNPSNNYVDIVAKLNIEAIEGKAWETFESLESTITDCLNLTLAGTGWQVGTCNITKKRTIRKDFCNSWDIIKQAVKTYRAEIELDSISKKINIFETLGADKGSFFMDSLNLRELSVQSNSYDYCTKLTAIGGTIEKEDGTKERLSCTVTNNTYSNKVIEQIWKDERYTVLADLQEDAQIKLDEMAKPYKSYSAKPYSIGNCQLGDTITLISKKNKVYSKFRIVSYTEYPLEIGKDEIEIANSILSFEDMQKEFEEASNTVDNITSDNGTISESAISIKTFENIYARSVVANKVQALEGEFGTLNATKANITDLQATNIKVQNLEANSATIIELNAATARIGTLETGYGQIHVLQTDVANINTLLAGSVSAGSTQTIVLNASNTAIANALIKSAMIESLDVNKINAGTISTNKFTIASDNGAILITDNTMQFKDSVGNVRIQIGQDTQNNFNFIVRAQDGTTVLIDGYGVKENAIADNLIKTNMLNDKAVKGQKIDWDDFFTTINADGTHTLNSSKVKLNSNNQTLDVAFNQLNSAITEGGRNLLITKNISLYKDHVVFDAVYLEINTDYVVNFDDFTHPSAFVTIEDGLGNIIKTLVNWGKLKGKYTFNQIGLNGNYILKLWGNSIDATYSNSSKKIKLEKGKIATTYSVAPEDVDNKILTNTTSISVQQGKIEQIISDVKDVKDNVSGLQTLTSNYNTVVDTVNSHTQTIGSQTSVSGDGSLFGSVKSINSSISQMQGLISLKVGQSYVTNAVDGIQIGGRNLLKQSFSEGDVDHVIFNGVLLETNTVYTLNMNDIGFASCRLTVEDNLGNIIKTLVDWNTCSGIIWFKDIPLNGPYKIVFWATGLQNSYNNSSKKIKLEKGTKATDYTPAPEDVQNYTDTQISAKSAEIKLTTDAITSRVSANETTLNASGTGLVSRMSSVEQNITASAITTKISQAINNGTNNISTTNFVMDIYGFHIKNGGFDIKNSAGKQIFGVNQDGNVDLIGVFRQFDNATGFKSADIVNNSINFYNWLIKDDFNGAIGSIVDSNNNTISGVGIHLEPEKFFDIGYKNGQLYNTYIRFDKDNITGKSYSTPIQVRENIGIFNTKLKFMDSNNSDRARMLTATNGNLLIESDTSTTIRLGQFSGSDSTTSNSKLEVNSNGIYVWGSVSSSNGDYAEYFEWLDENKDNEDRIGYLVTLDNGKIIKANSSDILGIISANPSVLGDCAKEEWCNKYLKDKYGRYVLDDEGQKQLNPLWDSTKEYVDRADRKEWDIVGMLGKLVIKTDGTLKINDYVTARNGIGTKSDTPTKIRVLQIIDKNTAKVLIN